MTLITCCDPWTPRRRIHPHGGLNATTAAMEVPDPTMDSSPTAEFPAKLAQRASAIHTGIPIPLRPLTVGEIELSCGSESSSEGGEEAAELELRVSE